jgi:hypothetical protein
MVAVPPCGKQAKLWSPPSFACLTLTGAGVPVSRSDADRERRENPFLQPLRRASPIRVHCGWPAQWMNRLPALTQRGRMTGAGVPAFQSNVRDKAARQAWLFVPSRHKLERSDARRRHMNLGVTTVSYPLPQPPSPGTECGNPAPVIRSPHANPAAQGWPGHRRIPSTFPTPRSRPGYRYWARSWGARGESGPHRELSIRLRYWPPPSTGRWPRG